MFLLKSTNHPHEFLFHTLYEYVCCLQAPDVLESVPTYLPHPQAGPQPSYTQLYQQKTGCFSVHAVDERVEVFGPLTTCFVSLALSPSSPPSHLFTCAQGRCTRENCKYLHPPAHLKTQLEINGRNNLIQQKTAAAMLAQQMQFMIPGTTMQPVVSDNSLLWELIVSLRK